MADHKNDNVKLRPPKIRKVKPDTFGKGQFKHKHHRSVRFFADELPELKEWLVGENYHLVLKVKETGAGIEEDEGSGRKGQLYADFRIEGVAYKSE